MSSDDAEIVKVTCIGCPIGCQLAVEHHGEDAWRVTGYECKKGRNFGEQEVRDPRRMVTTTVAVEGARWARLPVRTSGEVPKDLVVEVCRAAHQVTLSAPVRIGDVVLGDVLGTGVDIIATRSLAATAR